MENFDNRYGWTTPGSAEPNEPASTPPTANDEKEVYTAAGQPVQQPTYTPPAQEPQTPAAPTGVPVQANRTQQYSQSGQGGYYGSYYSGPYYQQGYSGGGYQPPAYTNLNPQDTPRPESPATVKTKSHEGRNWVMISIAMLLVALIAGFGGGYLANLQNGGGSTVVYRSPDTATGTRSGNLESSSLAEVADAAGQSVVSIVTENIVTSPFSSGEVQSGAGSGVIISQDGYIITNNHVIDGADKVVVTLADGTELIAQVIGADSSTDVAVLKVNATGLVSAVIGDDTNLRVGDLVLAIGNPMGTLGGTVTDGIISALNRDVTIDGNTQSLLQMSAAVSPGNSGGGLFNANAELIGIVNAKSNGDNTEGLGFAIPISQAMQVAEDLINLGYVSGRPGLGVTVRYVATAEQALQSGLNELGVYIEEVNPGSAAENAGIQPGDRMVSFNGTEINSTQELSNAIKRCSVGDTVEVVVSRGGEHMTVSVTLQELQATN